MLSWIVNDLGSFIRWPLRCHPGLLSPEHVIGVQPRWIQVLSALQQLWDQGTLCRWAFPWVSRVLVAQQLLSAKWMMGEQVWGESPQSSCGLLLETSCQHLQVLQCIRSRALVQPYSGQCNQRSLLECSVKERIISKLMACVSITTEGGTTQELKGTILCLWESPLGWGAEAKHVRKGCGRKIWRRLGYSSMYYRKWKDTVVFNCFLAPG